MLDPRYLLDFDCDAYVFIPRENLKEFGERLRMGLNESNIPNIGAYGTDVVYYDPLRIFDIIEEAIEQPFFTEKYKDF